MANRTLTIGSITLEEYPTARNFYLWKNPSETLSQLQIRESSAARQGNHGVVSSLSFYEARDLPFEVEIHAANRTQMFAMEQSLRSELALPLVQNYQSSDGFKTLVLLDEDAITKTLSARVIDSPDFTMIEDSYQRMRRVSFTMRSDDPIIFSQTGTIVNGNENVFTTNFKVPDASLPTVQDGDLPNFGELIDTSLTVTNSGGSPTPPTIIITGPTTNPVVLNKTTGVKMDFSRNAGVSLLAAETLTINVNSLSATKSDSTDQTGTITLDSEWMFLNAGANDISLYDATPEDLTATISVEFRSAWT